MATSFQPASSTGSKRRFSFTNDGLGRPTNISYIANVPAESVTYA